MLLLVKNDITIHVSLLVGLCMSDLDQMLKLLERARLASEARTANKNILADADPLHDIADNTVTKSHALSRAYYRFGLVEKRCMEALISKLHPLRNDNNLQEIELSALEYSKAYGITEKTAYRDLSSAINALMHRVISADRLNGKPGRHQLNVMDSAEYRDDEGKIVCSFTKSITPHLLGLREKFSSYPLKKAVDFNSSYTWRFYEFLVSWAQPKANTDGHFMGWIDRQNIEELREMLGVPDSYRWTDFEKRILGVAQAELKEKAHVFVSFERIKTIRKITHLNIKFIENDRLKIKSNLSVLM